MSKFVLRKRTSGFTTVSNNVIHVLKGNLPALALYVYLLSLPDNWEFYKTQICKECKIGIVKLEKLLKILASFELIQYGQKRNEKGQFSAFYIDIYDLESIKNKDLEETSPECQNSRTVKTVERSGEAIKEVLQNKNLKNKKKRESTLPKKSYCPGTIDLIISDEAIKIAKDKNIDINKTIYSFQQYALSVGWLRSDWKAAFVKWLIDEKIPNNPELIKNKNNELRSTVKFWGPGHPDYDRLN